MRRNTGTGDTSSLIPVQGFIDFPIVSSFYQHSFENPKSVKVRHGLFIATLRVNHFDNKIFVNIQKVYELIYRHGLRNKDIYLHKS